DHGKLIVWDPPVTLSPNGAPIQNPKSKIQSLSSLTGWWNGITTGDLDGDGRLDIVAANWGLNSDSSATPERPLPLYYGDLLERGVVNLIEAEWNPFANILAPRRRLDQ